MFHEKQFPESIKNLKEYEIHFGMAILAFRKDLGYKNKGDKIRPEQIVTIFKAGWKQEL